MHVIKWFIFQLTVFVVILALLINKRLERRRRSFEISSGILKVISYPPFRNDPKPTKNDQSKAKMAIRPDWAWPKARLRPKSRPNTLDLEAWPHKYGIRSPNSRPCPSFGGLTLNMWSDLQIWGLPQTGSVNSGSFRPKSSKITNFDHLAFYA